MKLHTFAALEVRLDALKRRCQTGYGCGSACISVKKECRSEAGSAPSKERIGRLQQLAQGEIKPKGLGVPKAAEAAAMAADLRGRRTSEAQRLLSQRQATRAAKGPQQASGGEPLDQEVKRLQRLQAQHEEHANRSGHHPGTVAREVIAGLQALQGRQEGEPLRWNIHGRNHEIPESKLQGLAPRQLSALIYTKVSGNKPARGQAFGGWFMEPEKAESSRPVAPPVLTNPGRIDPGLAPKPKQQGLNAQDVTTSAQQAAFARQQRQAAAAAGDQKGAAAWQQESRKVERERLQGAINRGQQRQASLFGVTEYDETMPLFRRQDSIDPVAQLVGQILAEQLPGAQVLDWSRQPRGITAGRAVSEGLVYRFRCDSDSIGYQPAWDGIDERQWELRSEGFLQARDPAARLDFKGPKFRQQQTKRKCSKGYGCGSACISMGKECRVSPSSAMSKARLRQLQALAQEGDAKAAMQVQELQLQRNAKAQGLQQGRQTAKLQELLKDPRIAEMVRTGKVPTAEAGSAPAAAPKPGDVRNVKPTDVDVDPERFQYKLAASKTGEVGSLSDVQRWDPNLAGVVSVWQDPADGKTYVINGHNRLAAAKRLGAEDITVRYLKAGSAKEARAIGAMQNIAEGSGSEVDAGKFFRDTGIKTLEQAQARGLPLRSGKAEKGVALAQLPDEMFQDVVQGNLRMRRAAVIGASGLDQDKQREVYKVLKQRPSMSDETLQEYVEHLAVSSRQTQTEIDLFGSSKKTVDTGLARAELSNTLKKALGREARLLGAVSKNSQAVELLERKGGNVINVEQSQQQAQEANSVLRVFNQLKSSGAVGAALDQAAARLTAGEGKSKVQKELREAVIQAMEEELKQLGLRKEEPKNEAPTMSMFDSVDRFAAIEARLDALKRKCNTGYACGSACISVKKECRSEGGRASTGKDRLRRLQELARAATPGRGIGQLRGEAAATKAAELQAARSQQAQQLRQARAIARQQAQEKAAAAAAKGRKAVKPPIPQGDEDQAPRPAPPAGGSASNPKQAFEAATTELGRGMFGSVRMGQDGLVIKRGVITQGEVRVLERLADSPVTPRLHAVQTMEGPTAFRKGKNGFMVMDAARGETLTAWIRGPERRPEELREVFSSMLRVRKSLHTAGVAHNDMHSSNLFWDAATKQMMAIDFGMSRIDPTAALIEALGTARGLMKFNKVEAPGDYQSRSTIQALNRGRAQTGNPDWQRFQANRRRVEAQLKAEGAGELITRSIRSVPKNNPLTKQRAAELIQMLYEGL